MVVMNQDDTFLHTFVHIKFTTREVCRFRTIEIDPELFRTIEIDADIFRN